MITLNWNAAPEWAEAHGLHSFNGEVKEYWLGADIFQRLDCDKPFPYGGGKGDSRHNPTRKQFIYVTDRPTPWDGEGIPLRGTKCEVQPWREHQAQWIEVEFIASWLAPNGQTYSWVHTGYGWLEPKMYRFRPIRTPEQIAAEKRKSGYEEIFNILNKRTDLLNAAADLYDAGYRKVAP